MNIQQLVGAIQQLSTRVQALENGFLAHKKCLEQDSQDIAKLTKGVAGARAEIGRLTGLVEGSNSAGGNLGGSAEAIDVGEGDEAADLVDGETYVDRNG